MKGQGIKEYLLMLGAVLILLAIATYYVTFHTPAIGEETIIMEGKIVDITYGTMTTVIWENEDGQFALKFYKFPDEVPLNTHVKLQYTYSTYRGELDVIIEINVEEMGEK